MEIFGKQCIVAAIDAKRNYSDSKNLRAWQNLLTKFLRTVEKNLPNLSFSMMGAGEILLKASMRTEQKTYEITLTKAVSKQFPYQSSLREDTLQHMADVLQNSGADAALAASIFHYDSHGLCTAKQFLKDQGISVRPCDKML